MWRTPGETQWGDACVEAYANVNVNVNANADVSCSCNSRSSYRYDGRTCIRPPLQSYTVQH